jgi:outer membrane protein assembly factor BamB
MNKSRVLGAAIVVCLILTGCSAHAIRPLVDPFPLRFPLVEAGTLTIDGHVVGQPRARDGVAYFATREGALTAVVVPAREVFWKFKAENAVSVSPELGESRVVLRDDGNDLYVFDLRGSLVLKKQLAEDVTTAVRENGGRVFFGTAAGRIIALDLSAGGEQLWEYVAAASARPITAGPVFSGDLVIFGAADGRILALDQDGKMAWVFAARGAITVDPAAVAGRLYFGTEDRHFYGLRLADGKAVWSRRLGGALLHPALAQGRRLVLAASNSVVYTLSAKGGSILSWEAVPSRIIHEMTTAGPLVLVTSASPTLVAFDPSTGKRVGQYEAPGPLAAGAVWVPPLVVAIADDSAKGRQNLVFLRSRPSSSAGAAII